MIDAHEVFFPNFCDFGSLDLFFWSPALDLISVDIEERCEFGSGGGAQGFRVIDFKSGQQFFDIDVAPSSIDII